MKEIDGKIMTIKVTHEIATEIERIAAKRDASQAQIYRMILRMGIAVHQDMERVGLIPAIDFAHYVKKAVREKIDKMGPKQLELL